MTLKQVIQSTRGLQYIIDQISVQSPIGRRYLYAESWSSDSNILNEKFNLIEQCTASINSLDRRTYNDLEHIFCQCKDIERTIDALMNGTILTDIEFFELKAFALISHKLKTIVDSWEIVSLPSLEQAIVILDPENTRTSSFYIYNVYDARLADLRSRLKNAKDEEATEIYLQTSAIEDDVRKNLAFQLRPLAAQMRKSLQAVAQLDILIAKANLNKSLNLVRPLISGSKTQYIGLFNPEILVSLKNTGREYQAIDVDTIESPTLITGINMGGKTVVLKTLALAQALCQLGFFVPAQKAEIALVDDIMVSMEDKQNELSGLSSFASEMMQINDIISCTKRGANILVLIDELARTTNPTEGRAIVEAMIEFLSKHRVRSFITTHYDHITTPCRRFRVKGLKEMSESINIKHIDQLIDYSLIEDDSSTVPHEALNIARLIGLDEEFINRANERIEVTDM